MVGLPTLPDGGGNVDDEPAGASPPMQSPAGRDQASGRGCGTRPFRQRRRRRDADEKEGSVHSEAEHSEDNVVQPPPRKRRKGATCGDSARGAQRSPQRPRRQRGTAHPPSSLERHIEVERTPTTTFEEFRKLVSFGHDANQGPGVTRASSTEWPDRERVGLQQNIVRRRQRQRCDEEDCSPIVGSDAEQGKDEDAVQPPRAKRRRPNTSAPTIRRTAPVRQARLRCTNSSLQQAPRPPPTQGPKRYQSQRNISEPQPPNVCKGSVKPKGSQQVRVVQVSRCCFVRGPSDQ